MIIRKKLRAAFRFHSERPRHQNGLHYRKYLRRFTFHKAGIKCETCILFVNGTQKLQPSKIYFVAVLEPGGAEGPF